ncbi:MAG TPA: tRNA (adenosine(37)-N6)-threonylcarbamoyltransferase complex ATPase subunit type 1 TsaE [Desulfobacterales bacterium]|nr:MAG: tRNA (adenosine(37)-N6)-threonylcarbamoyltransferase complex ATPase subunit type 1 TsaE [Deltaproteobacteria bacterium]HHC25256.1 tRNA (adenosine(37)-N6)-threonylcarbamoyltransferase complex ATPase subunit type 1 TsaE [Desulfobacterales bacterium]
MEPSQTIIAHSLEETHLLGKKIGEAIPPGTVIALTGDLGSGKTAFVQGLARGLDVPAGYYITSPTYTLINEYPGRCPLFHIDLYRLEEDDFEEIGLFELLHGEGVTAIEWADRLHKDILAEHIAMDFEILDDESRKICISEHGKARFLSGRIAILK